MTGTRTRLLFSASCRRVVVMKKRSAICFILLCYAVTACGSLLETDCRHNDPSHTASGQPPQHHVLSKNQMAIHLLLHAQEVPEPAKLTHGPCCCVSLGPEETGQSPHAPGRTSAVLNPEISSCKMLVILAVSNFQPLCLSGRPLIPLESTHSHLLAFRSISSTILLI